MIEKLPRNAGVLPMILCGLLFFAVPRSVYAASDTPVHSKAELRVTSDAFKEGEMIPPKYTCDKQNISPPLRWSGAPKNTQSFVIVVEDPDAVKGTWIHWILYDLPPTLDMIPSALPPISELANAEKNGINDFGQLGYGGPCPPPGVHRYFFKVYALDKMIFLSPGAKKTDIQTALQGHVLAEGALMGKYERKKA